MRYVIVEELTGMVTNMIEWDGVEWDVETGVGWSPEDGSIAIQSEDAQTGWTYADGVFTAPPVPEPEPPTPEQVLAGNIARRDALLAEATLAIAPLQDAVDLEIATAGETAKLKKWKLFRVNVNRLDMTVLAPVWPETPT
jgi:hypothetical protein